MNSPNRIDPTLTFLRRLAEEGFWGIVTIKFQHGEVIHLTKEEGIAPHKLEPETRRNHVSTSEAT